jgi:hypothetical protein
MAPDFAVGADSCPLLDLNECANLCLVPDLATVKVDKSVDLHIATQLHVWRDTLIEW